MKPTGLPPLEGWMALPDAAVELKMSRQRAHQLLKEALENQDTGRVHYFTTARQAGTVILVRTAEVQMLKALRAESQEDASAA